MLRHWSSHLGPELGLEGPLLILTLFVEGNLRRKFSSIQFSHSVMSDSLRPHESQHARPPCPSPTPRVHSDSVHRVSDVIQQSHPLSSPSPPAPNPSQHQSLFQWVNSSHGWPKYWSFSFSIIPSKEIPGLISFRIEYHNFTLLLQNEDFQEDL